MPFSNPIAGAAAEVSGLDYYQWPAISGEPLPPTLAKFTYTAIGGRPALRSDGGGSSFATYPFLPFIGARYNAQTAVEISFAFRYASAAASANWTLDMENSGTNSLRWAFSGNAGQVQLSDPIRPGGNIFFANISINTWYTFLLNVSALGVVTWKLNGVVQDTYTRATVWTGNAFQLIFGSFGSLAGVNAYFSNARVRWLTA